MSMYYVHKEPVFDKRRSLWGNEFLFRKHASNEDDAPWPVLSVDEEVVGALTSQGGFEGLVGNRPAFLYLDSAAVKGCVLAFLPRDSIFQLHERDTSNKEILLNAASLKKQGYQIVVDYAPSRRSLIPLDRIADFVRVDASSFSADHLSLLKGLPAKLIAASVQDEESFARFRDLGFELFQGPVFVKSPGNGPHTISSTQQVLLRLYNDLRANQDMGVIERTFKNNPKLSYGLLQLMNSAFFRIGPKVASIGHAITLLGYDNLGKWVVLLLFAVDRDAQSHPLIEKALTRSRLMESLALKAGKKALADSAFITGMLSFMNVFFNMRSDEVTEKLNLIKEIQDALTGREGVLGMLLALAEKADKQDYGDMEEDTEALNLSVEDVLWAETNAVMDWRVLEKPLNIRLAL